MCAALAYRYLVKKMRNRALRFGGSVIRPPGKPPNSGQTAVTESELGQNTKAAIVVAPPNALPPRAVAAVGEERTGLGRDGTGVHRKEIAVVPSSIPVAPASVPGAGPELLVRGERIDELRSRISPAAVATLPVMGVHAVAAIEVEQGVLPVAGLVHPVEHGVVVCRERGRRRAGAGVRVTSVSRPQW